MRPLEVEILFNNQPLSADRQYEVECQAIGSRPPSVITWWMNGMALVAQPTKVILFFIFCCLYAHENYFSSNFPLVFHLQTSQDGNVTTSTLLFIPARQDNGKNLVCRATNELVRNGVKETTLKMNVFCEYIFLLWAFAFIEGLSLQTFACVNLKNIVQKKYLHTALKLYFFFNLNFNFEVSKRKTRKLASIKFLSYLNVKA